MLTARVLNRTLLARQHLLERTAASPLAMIEHLVGLQAQETLPPYLGLWSRLDGFRPEQLSDLLESRQASRIVLMRGTIHLVSAADCLGLRPALQDTLERLMRGTPFVTHCADVPTDRLAAVAREILGSGPVSARHLGTALAERFPDHNPTDLANTVRLLVPLLQTPPRGVWGRGGAPTYALAEAWHGAPLSAFDLRDVLRRYLRAFGPATAADLSTWSGLTGVGPVLASMEEELVRETDDAGRTLFDLAGLPLADPDEPAPVRLLGKYDNVWLSHADRSRVSEPEKRQRWMVRNGGVGNAVFVDGMLEGLWRRDGGRVELELFRRLTGPERAELDAEVAALESFLDG